MTAVGEFAGYFARVECDEHLDAVHVAADRLRALFEEHLDAIGGSVYDPATNAGQMALEFSAIASKLDAVEAVVAEVTK